MLKVLTLVGVVVGWGGSLVLAVLGMTNVVGDETVAQLMMVGLSLALICSACLAVRRHQRPLGAAFELGYDLGRRDAIREGTRRASAPTSLSEYSRSAGA